MGTNYLRLRSKKDPQTRLVLESQDKDMYLFEIVWVSNNWEFLPSDDGLWGFSRYDDQVLDGKYLPWLCMLVSLPVL